MTKELDRILKRGVTEVIVEEELRRMLESGKPLRLKEGFDPSRPDIHLGHVVGLRKLRQFQELGHQVILIVGDWTAQIGDPTGQSQMRNMISAEEVRSNAETYMTQFFKVVDREKTVVRWQSDWFGKFSMADVISLTSKFTVAQMLAREDFSKRYAAGHPIGITELLYPLLQAYDSVMIESDVEFGGIDQKFNCLMGRELQEMMGQKPQQVFFTPLLVGTDGKMKMSKSLDNYIAVDDPPNEMYGKVMSLPDELIIDYFELITDVSDEELNEYRKMLAIDSMNPMVIKKRLAQVIVSEFHDAVAADTAQTAFEKQFQMRGVPNEIQEIRISFNEYIDSRIEHPPSDLLEAVKVEGSNTVRGAVSLAHILSRYGVVESNSQAKRLIAQDAVSLIYPDGQKSVYREGMYIRDGMIIKVGKRRFAKIVNADKD
ncbi:MAG: tyrosine--tRNA ligase [Chloroflexi bacterium]|jgi:tyrosyl-tRNA synthetase|nr:tyrosine--tRNA ligase [Chloroflexota bacterium]